MLQTISLPPAPKEYARELAVFLEKTNGLKQYYDQEEILWADLNSSHFEKVHPVWAIVMFGRPANFREFVREFEVEEGYNELRKRFLKGFHINHTDNWIDIMNWRSRQSVKTTKLNMDEIFWNVLCFSIQLLALWIYLSRFSSYL